VKHRHKQSSKYAQDFVGGWWADQDHEQIINLFQYVEVFSELRCSEKANKTMLDYSNKI
jgi:hypothetical protein